MRRVAVALAVIAAALVAVYASLPLWAPAALRPLLPAGLTVQRLALARPGWRSWKIERLALTYATETWRLQIDATDLALRYRWRDLRRGRLDAVRAAAMGVTLQRRAHAVATPPTAALLPTPAGLLTQIPAARVELPALTLQLPPPIGRWSGGAHLERGALTLDLRGRDRTGAATPQLAVSLHADRDNRLDLIVHSGGKLIAALHNRIAAPRTLHGDLTLQLAPLAALTRDSLANAQLTGTASLSWNGPLPAELSSNSWRSLTLHGAIAADVSGQRDATSAQLSARADYTFERGMLSLTFKSLNTHGALALPAAARALISGQSPLPFRGLLAAGTGLTLTTQPLRAALKGTAEFTVGPPPPAANARAIPPLRATTTLTDPVLTNAGDGPQLHTRFTLDAQAAQWRRGTYRLRRLRAQLRGELQGWPGRGSLQLDAGAQGRVHSVRGPSLAVAPLRIHTRQPLTASWRGHELKIARADLRLDGSAIDRSGQRIRFRSADMSLRNLQLDTGVPLTAAAQGAVRVDGLTLPAGPYRTRPLAVRADLQFAAAALRGRWRLTTPVAGLALSGELRQNIKTGRGELSAVLPPFAFRENGRYLPALIERWPYPLDFSGGRLGFDAHLSWGKALRGTLTVDADKLAGFYDMNTFQGLDARPRLTYARGALSLAPTRIALAGLNVGFPIQQLQCRISALLPDSINVDNLRVGLLGGTLSQPELHYRRGAKQIRATWHFEGIHLADLVALERHVEGTGVLDGRLPVVLTPAGIAVTGGEFRARGPGVIRYRGELPDSALTQAPALLLAVNSLRNFHYRTLDVSADYAPDGNLKLRVGLRGRNPDLHEKRPMQFNLTIHENLPNLLRGLQLDRNISDKIERRVQEFYRRK